MPPAAAVAVSTAAAVAPAVRIATGSPGGFRVTGRSMYGDEETVTLKGYDAQGLPQIRFDKYRRGRKVGVRMVTVDLESGRPARIEEFDGLGQLTRVATLVNGALVTKTVPEPKPAAKPPRHSPSRRSPSPAKRERRRLDKPPARRQRRTASAPGAVVRPSPTLPPSLPAQAPPPSPSEKPPIALTPPPRGPLTREMENDLLMREVLRSFYADIFEAGAERAKRAEAGETSKAFRPLAPKERAALATLSLIFGLADLGPEHLRLSEGRKPMLVGRTQVRREPLRLTDSDLPLIPVEIRMGHVPFVRLHPPLPREDYREEARRVQRMTEAPGFDERFRARLERAGLDARQSKAYWNAARSNLLRFDALLQPYLDAATGLEDLTDAP